MPPRRKQPVKADPPSKLIQELAFYRKYHYNSVNVAIHIVCIPIILLTSVYNLTQLRVNADTIASYVGSEYAYLAPYANAGLLVSVAYALYYTYLDVVFGLPVGTALIAAIAKFSTLSLQFGTWGYQVSWVTWAIGWTLQFIGHGVFEKRAPALLSNLTQALVLAPYFAVFEVAALLGIRRGLMTEVDQLVLPEIEQFRLSQAASEDPDAKPKRTRKAKAAAVAATTGEGAPVYIEEKPKKRATRAKKAETAEVEPAKPKRVTRARKAAAAAEPAAEPAAPKRTTRKKAT